MALDFYAGCLGGCAGVLVGHPFDTVKVRLQTQDYSRPTYRGTWHCISTIVREESFRGLFKGMSSPMVGLAGINAIVFGIYGNILRSTPDPNSLASHFFAGTAAGLVQSVVTSPMELTKTRMQLQGQPVKTTTSMYKKVLLKPKYKNPLDCMKKVFRAEGFGGIFRGLGCTILRDSPAFAVYFTGFEFFTQLVTKTDGTVSAPALLFAGGLAGVLSWVVIYPIDVIKSRMQVDGMAGPRKYGGIIDCVRKSYHSEGLSVFFRGLNSTIIRAFPTNAATFAVFTWMFVVFDKALQARSHVEIDDLPMEHKLHRIATYFDSCAWTM